MTKKKTLKETLEAYERQIRDDMGFWIKYRPSRWRDFLPDKCIRPLLILIKTKRGKNFLVILAFLLSFIFVGVMPTLNFIWSNIFRVWLILLFIPLIYWTLAIASVYTRVLCKVVFEFVKAFLASIVKEVTRRFLTNKYMTRVSTYKVGNYKRVTVPWEHCVVDLFPVASISDSKDKGSQPICFLGRR